jgi:hypothetical protein
MIIICSIFTVTENTKIGTPLCDYRARLQHDRPISYMRHVIQAHIYVQGDSKLLSGFPWPIIFRSEITK